MKSLHSKKRKKKEIQVFSLCSVRANSIIQLKYCHNLPLFFPILFTFNSKKKKKRREISELNQLIGLYDTLLEFSYWSYWLFRKWHIGNITWVWGLQQNYNFGQVTLHFLQFDNFIFFLLLFWVLDPWCLFEIA